MVYRKDMNDMVSGEEFIGKWIEIISKHMHYYIHKRLDKLGDYSFGRGEFKFLINIYRHSGICQEGLAEILKSHPYEVTKGIKKLENMGLVERTRDPEDKRIYRLHPTPQALAIKDDFNGILSDTTSIMTKGFSTSEREQIMDYLVRMAINMYVAASRLKPEG